MEMLSCHFLVKIGAVYFPRCRYGLKYCQAHRHVPSLAMSCLLRHNDGMGMGTDTLEFYIQGVPKKNTSVALCDKWLLKHFYWDPPVVS